MKLKTIKAQIGDDEYNELISKTIELIVNELSLDLKLNFLFFLCWCRNKIIFLYENTVIAVDVEVNYDENKKPILSSMVINELCTIKLLKEYPKTEQDIEFKTIINKSGKNCFNAEKFLNWIDEPSEINEKIDEPYYKVISYLQKYNKNTFSTERYNFYSKWDNDSNFITNIYAYDKKNQAEMKLYIPDKFEKNNDIAVDDLSGKLSNFKKRQCKEVFLRIANQENEYFKTKNYWVMELVKYTIQPILNLHEWSIHRIFCKPEKFSNIWVYDFPDKNEEPYFFITDHNLIQETTKIAVLNFKNPAYHIKGIYKRGNVKRKNWLLDENYIKELMKFLKAPCTDEFCKRKYVETNWQKMIFEYNHNTAGWGWGETGFDIPPEIDTNRTEEGIEALPFNLPIPDYTKLLQDK